MAGSGGEAKRLPLSAVVTLLRACVAFPAGASFAYYFVAGMGKRDTHTSTHVCRLPTQREPISTGSFSRPSLCNPCRFFCPSLPQLARARGFISPLPERRGGPYGEDHPLLQPRGAPAAGRNYLARLPRAEARLRPNAHHQKIHRDELLGEEGLPLL